MKLGFICPNVLGHLNPMTALARQLQARCHDVVLLYSSSASGLPVFLVPRRITLTKTEAKRAGCRERIL